MATAALPATPADSGQVTADPPSDSGPEDSREEHSLTFVVDGIHCASCVRLIENTLLAQEDVISARVNMSTNRLTFSWKGSRARGNELADIVSGLGYSLKPYTEDDASEKSLSYEKHLLRCIAVAGFAAGNMMLLSVALWSTSSETMGIATRDLFHWLSALIALPAIIYSGRPFFIPAASALAHGRTNMDVPISLAIILASAMSLLETIRHGEHIYFDSAVMLLFFLLIGRYLDARARGKARQSAQNLLSMLRGNATVITADGQRKTVPLSELRSGMSVLVASGENIPADGIIEQGESDIDMSLISGESIPQHAVEGSRVFAGTTNISAPLRIRVSGAGKDTLLSDIVKLMEQAEQGQARYVRLADRAAKLYTPVVHSLGALTFLGWWLVMEEAWQVSLLHGITVLIITCPCALGLAVPVVQVLASGILMRRGILLKSGDALERLATVTAAVFDKTGTLTVGKPQLLNRDSHQQPDIRLAASLAAHSRHPLSLALSHAYAGELLPIESVREIPGKGIEAIYNGKVVRLGSRDWCGGDAAGDSDHPAALELWLAVDGKTPQAFAFADPLREDAAMVISRLQQAGIRTILLSGDREQAVVKTAQQVKIKEYHAALSPPDKCHHLEELKSSGEKILMVGDGLNDAPALAAALVSMSPSTAVDISQNTADIVFQGSRLEPVYTAWQVAKGSDSLVKQNFALAVIYNIFAIPLAVMGYVTPLIAAVAMSASSLLVIGNSFRLKLKNRSAAG